MLHRILESYKSGLLPALYDEVIQWSAGLLLFILVGMVYWAAVTRKKPHHSLRALLTYLFPKHLYTHPSMRVVYKSYVFYLFLVTPFLTVALTLFQFHIAEHVAHVLGIRLGVPSRVFSSDGASIAVQIPTVLLSQTFFGYVIHYAMHKVPLLWSLHRPHHSAESLGLTAILRFHPLEPLVSSIVIGVGSGLITGLVLYFTGVTKVLPITMATIGTLNLWDGVVFNFFQHSHVPISFGWMNRIFSSPVLHQIHHSAELRHRDKNFCAGGLHIGIWDWIFGTLYIPEKDEQYRWGLNDEEYGANNPHQTLCDYYFEPFRYAWGVIRGWKNSTASNQ